MKKEVFYLKLDKPSAMQLLDYIKLSEINDFYTGDKRWFLKRQKELKESCENLLLLRLQCIKHKKIILRHIGCQECNFKELKKEP